MAQRVNDLPGQTAVVNAVKAASEVLGNTPEVCRRSYIHPALIDLYLDGRFDEAWNRGAHSEPVREHLGESERIFLGLLRQVRYASSSTTASTKSS
ncbi:MAG: hypothetical protein CVT60_05740 [Actinobacteria bacterium HGW-Actinobacteria-10]|jgi:DNA topoisomerase-1|nr:MAG: hypothetical protein CVT60_05740 [Actinobacteria bacterium HGW-Actinobacteria-10]